LSDGLDQEHVGSEFVPEELAALMPTVDSRPDIAGFAGAGFAGAGFPGMIANASPAFVNPVGENF
jgi:hypothetical protein